MICKTPEESSLATKSCFFVLFFFCKHISSGNKHIRKLYDSKLKNNNSKYKKSLGKNNGPLGDETLVFGKK